MSGIRDVRLSLIPVHESYLKRTDLHPGVKEFMVALYDPKGRWITAAYRSWQKGQTVLNDLAQTIATKHGIDPKMLRDAEFNDRCSRLSW